MKKIIILLIIIICFIVLCLNSCTVTYRTCKVVKKETYCKFWTKYVLQEFNEDEIIYGEYVMTDNYFKLISRNDSIDKWDFYTHDRKHFLKKHR